LPSLRSTDTPNVAPHLRPVGSFAQPSSRRYGFGAALGPGMPCGKVGAAENANAATTATISAPPTCCTYRMRLLRFGSVLHCPVKLKSLSPPPSPPRMREDAPPSTHPVQGDQTSIPGPAAARRFRGFSG